MGRRGPDEWRAYSRGCAAGVQIGRAGGGGGGGGDPCYTAAVVSPHASARREVTANAGNCSGP